MTTTNLAQDRELANERINAIFQGAGDVAGHVKTRDPHHWSRRRVAGRPIVANVDT